jgi:hypothetical protein
MRCKGRAASRHTEGCKENKQVDHESIAELIRGAHGFTRVSVLDEAVLAVAPPSPPPSIKATDSFA